MALPAASQPTADGRKILDRVVAAYQTVAGYELDARVSDRAPDAAPRQTTVAIAYAAPDRLMVQDKSTSRITAFHDHGVATYDGKSGGFIGHGPTFLPTPEKLREEAAQRTQALEKAGFADYTAIEKGISSARVVRHEGYVLDGKTIACTVVEASYAHSLPRTFWVDEEHFNVLREASTGPAGEHTIEVVKLNWGEAPPAQLFELEQAIRRNVGGNSNPRAVDFIRCVPTTPEAEIAHLHGTVNLKATVDVHGEVRDVQVEDPLGLGVDDVAAECLSQSQFWPAQRDGELVEGSVEMGMGVAAEPRERGRVPSDWSLNRIVFDTPAGATRPVLVKADYPAGAGAIGHATFHLAALIDTAGMPQNIEATGPDDEKLRKEAVKIASSYRFHPGEDNGVPIAVGARFDLVIGPGGAQGGPRPNVPNCELVTPETQLARLKGRITLSLNVDAEGQASGIQVVHSLGLGTDEKAIECMTHPSRPLTARDGKPVIGQTTAGLFVYADPTFSDWTLGAAAFQPPAGASRAVFLKVPYPKPGKRSNGAFRDATVHLSLIIDRSGIPRNIQVTGGDGPGFGKEAAEIVSAWRFQPGLQDGQPVDVPARFDLVKGGAIRLSQ